MTDLALEALLTCETCRAIPYKLYRRRNRQADGAPLMTYEHCLWPTTPDVPPPARTDRITCPACGGALKRVAA